MNKMIATLKSVNKLGLGAIIITAGLLMGFKASDHKLVTEKWAYQSGTWIDVTGQMQQTTPGGPGQYRCNLNEQTRCTALFDENVDPNTDDSSAQTIVFGEYEPIEQD